MMEMRGLRESMGPMSHGVSVVKNDKQIAPNFCTNSYVETCFLGKLFSTKTQQCCFAENKKKSTKNEHNRSFKLCCFHFNQNLQTLKNKR
jgi:hypothetical protein